MMLQITLLQPNRLVFGVDSIKRFETDYRSLGLERLLIITAPQIIPSIEEIILSLKNGGKHVLVDESITTEPTIKMVEVIIEKARKENIDSVMGIGGGSVLDVAKIVAALIKNRQEIHETFGIEKLKNRKTYLACLPTTSGTGSEVSPNAILLDESDLLKKGIISKHIVPDSAYIDPKLTISVPPFVTAATGMDALTHCIEAYANKFAHPVTDVYALEGIKLIASNLKRAVDNGKDIEARERLSLGSYYGGLCLGPVNTAAVHAISYPLGGEYHISRGVANALLLPYVLEYNLEAAVERYKNIAIAFGIEKRESSLQTAKEGILFIKKLSTEIGLPAKLSSLDIKEGSIDKLSMMAFSVKRLLKNNPKELSIDDIKNIYSAAL